MKNYGTFGILSSIRTRRYVFDAQKPEIGIYSKCFAKKLINFLILGWLVENKQFQSITK